MQPVRANIDQVHGRVFAQGHIRILLTAVNVGLKSLSDEILKAGGGPVAFYVAHCSNVAARHKGQTLYGVGTPHSQSHYAYTHVGYGFRGELYHILLTCRTGRHGGADGCDGVRTRTESHNTAEYGKAEY